MSLHGNASALIVAYLSIVVAKIDFECSAMCSALPTNAPEAWFRFPSSCKTDLCKASGIPSRRRGLKA